MSVLSFAGDEVKVLADVVTGPRAKTGAMDEATGRIYLGTAKFAPPEKEGGRPKALPGTFEIIVLSDEN
jgi:hypothetical protein